MDHCACGGKLTIFEYKRVCTKCGTQTCEMFFEENVLFKNLPKSRTRFVYLRIVRFRRLFNTHFFTAAQRRILLENFTRIEMSWEANKNQWARKYFLNLKFCLWTLCQKLLNIDLSKKNGPCLKDSIRVEEQYKIFKHLSESSFPPLSNNVTVQYLKKRPKKDSESPEKPVTRPMIKPNDIWSLFSKAS